MNQIREFEYRFKDDILQILSENSYKFFNLAKTNIIVSNYFQDTSLSYDLVFKRRFEISVRIRSYKYISYNDFTIRNRSTYGNVTEIDKLILGYGMIYFYGWMDESETKLLRWLLFRVDRIRNHLANNGVIYNNIDATQLRVYPISFLEKNNALISQKKYSCFA